MTNIKNKEVEILGKISEEISKIEARPILLKLFSSNWSEVHNLLQLYGRSNEVPVRSKKFLSYLLNFHSLFGNNSKLISEIDSRILYLDLLYDDKINHQASAGDLIKKHFHEKLDYLIELKSKRSNFSPSSISLIKQSIYPASNLKNYENYLDIYYYNSEILDIYRKYLEKENEYLIGVLTPDTATQPESDSAVCYMLVKLKSLYHKLSANISPEFYGSTKLRTEKLSYHSKVLLQENLMQAPL